MGTRQVGRTFYKGCAVTTLAVIVISFKVAISWYQPDNSLEAHKRAFDLYHQENAHHTLTGRLSRHLLDDDECREVHNADDKCDFVTTNEACEKEEGFPALDYNKFVYCDVGEIGGMTILVLWWLWLFVGLAVCADDFFCPSLVVISDTLRLSPNVAGVTFLAFGNGAPDLFSAIAALGSSGDNPEMGIAGLFGAGTFVTTVVVGTIAVIKPFKAMERPFLRDVIFYIALVYWVFAILWRGKVYIGEAVGFILLYCFYVVVVVISGSVYKKLEARAKGKLAQDANIDLSSATFRNLGADISTSTETIQTTIIGSPSSVSFNSGFEKDTEEVMLEHPKTSELVTNQAEDAENNNSRPAGLENGDMSALQHALGVASNDGSEVSEEETGPPPTVPQEFLMALNPIDVDEWPEMRWYARAYEVFKCPLVFIIRLTCPVVNYEVPETHNWNRWLQCLQLVVGPTACLFLIQFGDAWIDDVFPVWGITLIIGVAFGLLVWFTSVNDKKPKYHWVFGYLEFVIAIVWIYVIANEIVALLQTFGVVFNISDAILGLTLLAWGNSIGDWIADSLMARQGFARMGFAACYGAPFFNLSLGFGIPYLIQMADAGVSELHLRMSNVLLILSIFLVGSLVSSLVILPLRRFRVEKFFGIYLMLFYIVFLVFALLAETNVILKDWAPS